MEINNIRVENMGWKSAWELTKGALRREGVWVNGCIDPIFLDLIGDEWSA
jgi:hypothetical protein